MAWRLAQQLPGIERLTPGQSKDWNEQLMHPEQSVRVVQPTANQAQMNQLWQWHIAATKLGRPEAYLNRITEVAKESAKGVSLSEKAAAAMTRDITQFAQTLGKPRPVPKPAHSVEIER
jgi:hypothetical protein